MACLILTWTQRCRHVTVSASLMSVFVSATRSWRRGVLSCLWAVAALLGPASAFAELPIMPGSPANQFCDRAIDTAERRNATPPQLLAAIGQVESGRRDPTSGRWHPWPWTANAEGQGYFYDTKADAVAAVTRHARQGVKVNRYRLHAGEPPVSSGRICQLGVGVRSAGQRALCRSLPAGVVRPDKRLAEGGRAVPLGDAATGGGLSAEGHDSLAGAEEVGWQSACAGVGRDTRRNLAGRRAWRECTGCACQSRSRPPPPTGHRHYADWSLGR